MTGLRGAVMVVMTVVVMTGGSKCRAGKNKNEQDSNNDLLHGPNVAWEPLWKPAVVSRQERDRRGAGNITRGVN
jgi:hypothetical protein